MTSRRISRRRLWSIDGIGLGVCAALSLAGCLVVIQPVLRAGTQRTAMRSTLGEQKSRAAELRQRRVALGRELERLDEQLAASELQLQSPQYLNRRMARLVELAAGSGLDIHETRQGKVRAHQRLQQVPLHLAGTGSYPDCAAFLHRVHETLPDMSIVDFELTGHPGARAVPADFRFDLVWYAAPARAEAPR